MLKKQDEPPALALYPPLTKSHHTRQMARRPLYQSPDGGQCAGARIEGMKLKQLPRSLHDSAEDLRAVEPCSTKYGASLAMKWPVSLKPVQTPSKTRNPDGGRARSAISKPCATNRLSPNSLPVPTNPHPILSGTLSRSGRPPGLRRCIGHCRKQHGRKTVLVLRRLSRSPGRSLGCTHPQGLRTCC